MIVLKTVPPLPEIGTRNRKMPITRSASAKRLLSLSDGNYGHKKNDPPKSELDITGMRTHEFGRRSETH